MLPSGARMNPRVKYRDARPFEPVIVFSYTFGRKITGWKPVPQSHLILEG